MMFSELQKQFLANWRKSSKNTKRVYWGLAIFLLVLFLFSSLAGKIGLGICFILFFCSMGMEKH